MNFKKLLEDSEVSEKRCAAVAVRDELEAQTQLRAENFDLKNRLKQIQLWASGVQL